jgi:hypothetical protein
MYMLFCAAAPDLYAFFTKKAYSKTFSPFLKEVEEVPDFNNCTDNNQREMLKLTHALAKKTRADIVTMNAALLDVFLMNLPKLICNGYDPIRMGLPNTAFLHMFDWFFKKYGIMTAKEREENQQQMAAKQTVLSSLSCGSSLARRMQAQQGIRWKSATSLTLAYA